MAQLWFRAKHYGWGWYPVTWQGWLTLVIGVWAIAYIVTETDRLSLSASDTLMLSFVPVLLVATGVILICYAKGEKPNK